MNLRRSVIDLGVSMSRIAVILSGSARTSIRCPRNFRGALEIPNGSLLKQNRPKGVMKVVSITVVLLTGVFAKTHC